MRIQNSFTLLFAILLLTKADSFQSFKKTSILRHFSIQKEKCGKNIPLHSVATAATDVTAVAKKKATAVLAGNLLPFASKFIAIFIPGKKRIALTKALKDTADIREIIILSFFGWGWPWLFKKIYDLRVSSTFSGAKVMDEHETVKLNRSRDDNEKFTTSYFGLSSIHIGNAAKIAFAVYIADLLAVSLNAVGFKYFQQSGFSHAGARVGFSIWASMRLRYLKKMYFARSIRKNPNTRARALIIDRALDVLIYLTTTAIVIDLLQIDFGLAVSSLFAFGGVGTVVLSLASKDVANALISGLALGASQRFAVGDEIILGDGTAGFVTSLGWFDSEIRSYDETITKIPNAQLASLRVTNKSIIKWSQVKQSLAFSYADIDKIPVILETIKEEIQKTMGSRLITKGRPFRAHLRNFASDHLEVVVDVHLFLPPTGDVYWDARQEVLFAIARAVKKLHVKFAFPTFSTHISSGPLGLK